MLCCEITNSTATLCRSAYVDAQACPCAGYYFSSFHLFHYAGIMLERGESPQIFFAKRIALHIAMRVLATRIRVLGTFINANRLEYIILYI